MDELTLGDHITNLQSALDDYQRSVTKLQDWITFEAEQMWRDQAALRDELHESVVALSNRIEAATATPFGGHHADA